MLIIHFKIYSSANNQESENIQILSNETQNEQLTFIKNQSFDSYGDFERHFNKYQFQSKQLFIVSNSAIKENEDQPKFRVFKCIQCVIK